MQPARVGRPTFRRLAEAQAAHAAGDGLVAVALADTLFFSVPLGQARDKVALYLALTMAPFSVLSPFVGPWLDRWRGSYRIAVVTSAAGRVLLAVLLSSRTERLQLYPLAFGLLVLSRVHGVSRSALVPETLPLGRSLMWGNAWLAVVSVVAGAAGAGSAVGINALWGPDATLWAAAVVFAAGVTACIGMPRAQKGDRRRETVEDFRRLLSPRLLAGGLAMAASRAAVGFLTFFMAFVLRAQGEDGKGLAVVLVAAGLGGFVGSVVAPLLRVVLRESMLLLATLALMGSVALWLAAGGFRLAAAAVVAATVGFGSAAGRLAFDSLLQHDAPDTIRGRTFARYETIFQVCWVAGAAVATVVPFRAAAGLRTLAAICVGGLVLSLAGLVRRRGRGHRDTTDPSRCLPRGERRR